MEQTVSKQDYLRQRQKAKFIRLIVEGDDSRKEAMIGRLTADMEKNIVPVRKLKSSPRKWKYFNKYKCNQKPSFMVT